jgi:cell division protein ZapA
MAADGERIVPVVIHGQRYPVRSALESSYIAELASYVDEKMRIAADDNQTADSVRVAVLAALNLADEIFRYRDRLAGTEALTDRARALEALLDTALADDAPRLR